MYRKVPADLMEGSQSGSYFSYVAVIGLLLLFLCESGEYFAKKYV